jgi:hypothetical protein
MKTCLKLLSLIFLVLFTSNAWAVDLAWDHDNPAIVTGYTLYYAPTDAVPEIDGGHIFNINDGMVMLATLPEEHFKPGLEYTIYATAYNISGESDASESITYMRTGYGPPPNKPPIKLWIKPGKPIVIHIY